MRLVDEARTNADLESVVAFVIRRIEEEAERAGEPLDDEAQLLLNDLPKNPEPVHIVDPRYPSAVPRDFRYEKIYEYARIAHERDQALDDDGPRKWDFAAAVLKRYDHPLFRVLGWAGMCEKRPWWDRLLLWIAGVLLVVLMLGSMFVTGAAEDHPSRLTIYAGIAAYISLLCAIYFVLRSFENWQLDRTIETLRSRFNNLIA